MKHISSQIVDTLNESGYTLISRPSKREVVLQHIDSNQKELWTCNNDFAGYVIKIGRWKYEFASTYIDIDNL